MPHTNMEERMIEQAFSDIATACRNLTQSEASALFARFNIPPMLAAYFSPPAKADATQPAITEADIQVPRRSRSRK